MISTSCFFLFTSYLPLFALCLLPFTLYLLPSMRSAEGHITALANAALHFGCSINWEDIA